MNVDTDSQKSKADKIFFGGHGQKWVWPVWLQTLKLTVSQKWANGTNRLSYKLNFLYFFDFFFFFNTDIIFNLAGHTERLMNLKQQDPVWAVHNWWQTESHFKTFN